MRDYSYFISPMVSKEISLINFSSVAVVMNDNFRYSGLLSTETLGCMTLNAARKELVDLVL